MYRADPAPAFIVPEDVQNGEHELSRLGQGAVLDRELVVFNVGEGDVVCVCEVWEVRGVWGEFTGFGEVNEGANACGEEFVEFLGGGLEWRPGVFAGEELGCCPVGVGDGMRAVSVDGWQGRATLRAAGVEDDGGDAEGVSHVWCCGDCGASRRRRGYLSACDTRHRRPRCVHFVQHACREAAPPWRVLPHSELDPIFDVSLFHCHRTASRVV